MQLKSIKRPEKLENAIKKFSLLLFFIISAIIVLYPLLKLNAIPYGWDQRFHLNRIEEIAISLKSGHLFPTNGLHSFSNYGLAVNSFYPYLFLYPFAIVRLLLSPIHAYVLVLLGYVVLSQIISYLCARRIPQIKHAALLFSTLYNFSGYALLQIEMRADLGEYFALIFLPIAFVGAYSLLIKDSNDWIWLPIGMSAIAYSHILSIWM